MTSGNEKTNIDIEKLFDNETNDDLKRNFMGFYLSDSITKYIDFYDIMKQKRAKYQFTIFNTDRENKPGMHWWSFLDIYLQKDLLLFDSFGFVGFKLFIIDNDSAVQLYIKCYLILKKKKHKQSYKAYISHLFY